MINSKILFWAPRLIAITYILYSLSLSLYLFSLGLNMQDLLVAFLMSNILTIIMSLILIFAWKKDIVGALGYFVMVMLYLIFVIYSYQDISLFFNMFTLKTILITLPMFLISFLFYLNHKYNKKNIERKDIND